MDRMNSMDGMSHGFIPKHGGYRNLVAYRIAEIIDDFTFRFCNKYVKNQGRTHDQLVQAARSGMQNIAEGSVDSGVSKASELKLTGISKGSLQELKEDYCSYLRQRGLEQWENNSFYAQELIRARFLPPRKLFGGWEDTGISARINSARIQPSSSLTRLLDFLRG